MKKKYIIVDATGCNKKEYDVTREFSFNDFDNFYKEKDKKLNLDELLALDNIDKKYRKIVFEVSKPLIGEPKLKEFITYRDFIVKGKKVKRITTPPKYHDGTIFREEITINPSREEYVDIYFVRKFFEEMGIDGQISDYLSVVHSYFGSNLKEKEMRLIYK